MSMIFPIEGTWALAGSDLTLTATKVAGQSLADMKAKAPPGTGTSIGTQPLVFTVSSDSTRLTQSGNGAGKFPMKWVKDTTTK